MDKKFWFQLLGLTILIMGAAFLTFNSKYLIPVTAPFVRPLTSESAPTNSLTNLRIVDAAGNEKAVLNIELADTDAKRSKGLGFRDSLATNSGMLFDHNPPAKYTYWMKGMRFPIDILWIRDDEIVDIQPGIPIPVEGQSDDTLEKYRSTVEINRVLETNAGFVDVNNIVRGDKIILK